MEGDAIENGSQGHAFGTSFTGVGGKKYAVCAVWEVFASGRNPSQAYVFPFPETDFCLGYQKFIMWAHNAGFVRERFRTGLFKGLSGMILTNMCVFGVSSFWGLFFIQA